MKKLFLISLLLAAVTLIHSCSDNNDLTVDGSIAGVGSQSVTLTYFAGGGMKHQTITPSDGKFSFKGESVQPTMAILTVAPEGVRIATLVVKNGDHITIEADLGNCYATKVSGNSDSEAIAAWTARNAKTLEAGKAAEINRIVSNYVRDNKSRLSATAILTSFFLSEGYESAADSLLAALDAGVRRPEMTQGFNNVISDVLGSATAGPVPFMSLYSSNDSIISINPLRHQATLLCFLSASRNERDSVVEQLRILNNGYSREKLAIAEISMAPDSAAWRTSIGRDTVGWARTWVRGSVAGAPIRRLGVRRIPYFIVADSAGTTLYRGPSISLARKTVEKRLKN